MRGLHYLAVVTSVSGRTVTVIAWALRLDDTDPGVLTKFPPAVRPVTVSNVGPRPTIADPQRVGGLVDIERPKQ